jgi:nicotinamide riboside transporter PnuC
MVSLVVLAGHRFLSERAMIITTIVVTGIVFTMIGAAIGYILGYIEAENHRCGSLFRRLLALPRLRRPD